MVLALATLGDLTQIGRFLKGHAHWKSLYAKVSALWIIYIGEACKAKLLATLTCDNDYCTCLGHLGRHDTDRIISILCHAT